MNTSVHIPKEIDERLSTYLKHNQVPKNKFIVEAIEKLLSQKEQETGWHPDIINWQGVSDVEFEVDLDRDFLMPSREDVF